MILVNATTLHHVYVNNQTRHSKSQYVPTEVPGSSSKPWRVASHASPAVRAPLRPPCPFCMEQPPPSSCLAPHVWHSASWRSRFLLSHLGFWQASACSDSLANFWRVGEKMFPPLEGLRTRVLGSKLWLSLVQWLCQMTREFFSSLGFVHITR